MSRSITGTVRRFDGTAWPGAEIEISLLTNTATDPDKLYPVWTKKIVATSAGAIPAGTTLDTPASGAYRYRIAAEGNAPAEFYLEQGDGSALSIDEIYALAEVAGSEAGTPQGEFLLDLYTAVNGADDGLLLETSGGGLAVTGAPSANVPNADQAAALAAYEAALAAAEAGQVLTASGPGEAAFAAAAGGASDVSGLTTIGLTGLNLLRVNAAGDGVEEVTPVQTLDDITDGQITRVGDYLISGLPTADPLVLNALFSDSGTLKISAGSTLNNGLVSYWGLSEESGNRANSIVGENDAVPVNGPTATPGLVGNAAQLNTTSPARYFTVAAAGSSIPTTGTRTWAFIVKWDNLSAQPGLFSSSNDLDFYALLLGASQFARARIKTNITTYNVNSQAVITATGAWHIIRIWWDADANELGIQVDGNAKVTTATSGTPDWGSTGWKLGQWGSFAHDGAMDEFAIWNRVLSDAEWTALRAAWEGGSGHPF